jgi:hypothetical protein
METVRHRALSDEDERPGRLGDADRRRDDRPRATPPLKRLVARGAEGTTDHLAAVVARGVAHVGGDVADLEADLERVEIRARARERIVGHIARRSKRIWLPEQGEVPMHCGVTGTKVPGAAALSHQVGRGRERRRAAARARAARMKRRGWPARRHLVHEAHRA